MPAFLLKLAGVDVDAASNITSATLRLRYIDSLGWIILLALVLAGLTWWTYWRKPAHPLPRPRRRTLMILRILVFALLLFALLRPVVTFTIAGTIRRMVVGLWDASLSMAIQDPRLDPSDVKRVAIARGELPAAKGLQQNLDAGKMKSLQNVPRHQVLQDVLQNKELNLLGDLRKSFDVTAFTFGNEIAEVALPADPANPGDAFAKILAPRSPLTAIGDSIRDLLNRKRGQPLAGIFIATDGANNSGSEAAAAATLAQQQGVPLYVYGVGITSPRDIIVGNLFAPEVAFEKDDFNITVRVRGQDLVGQNARLVVKLGPDVVATKELTFANDDEQVIPVTFAPPKKGEFDLSASIEPRADEAVKDNNAVSQRLKVIDDKVKVLLVEQSPRWEFRYIQTVLQRDRRIETKTYLIESDPAIAATPDSPYLSSFPKTRDELFKYDLVIIGDVDPKLITPQQTDYLVEWISKFGGACIFLAGDQFNPNAYARTPLEKLVPVEPDPGRRDTLNQPKPRPTRLELTAAGRGHPLLKLAPQEGENAAIWSRFEPVFSVTKVGRAKPAAQVLVADPDPTRETRYGKMPVIAVAPYGLGQVLYIGTDNMWRWRRGRGEELHSMLWAQLTQKMALTHLLGGSKRTQLTADKQKYSTGERVTVFAKLYTESFEPVREQTVTGSYTIDDGKGATESREVQLRAVADQPGVFRGDFIAGHAGNYKVNVDNDTASVLNLTVAEPRFELGETAMQEASLRALAEGSGGAFFREEDLHKLAKTVAGKTENVTTSVDAELWSSPLYFLLILGVAAAEWILRKRSQLK
jgi:hypothetical protein